MTTPIHTIGIVGGNLVAAMLCLEAKKRGIQTILLEPELRNIASEVADSHMTSTIHKQSLERLGLRTDALIFCTSNIPVLDGNFIEENRCYPGREGIELVASRVEQLVTAQLCDVPTPPFFHESNKLKFFKQLENIKLPFKLYQIYNDGYEMLEVNEPEDIENFLMEVDEEAVEWLIEEVTEYERILSITALANHQKVFTYPIQEENLKENDVKYISMPASITKSMEQKLSKYTRKILKEKECEGVFTLKFGVKKNRSVELININPGITVGDIATNHYTDLSVYEQFFNLIEGKPLKDGELMKPCTVTIVQRDDKNHIPAFPYHYYVMDKNNKMPVSLYVKQDNIEK